MEIISKRRLLLLSAICLINAATVMSQSVASTQAGDPAPAMLKVNAAKVEDRKDEVSRLAALEEAFREQHAQLEELRKLMLEQQGTIKQLSEKLAVTNNTNCELVATEVTSSASTDGPNIAASSQTPSEEDRLKKVEGRIAEIGAVKVSGDIRLRSESFFGLSNNLASGNNPAALGNELSPRHRMRLRARLAFRGSVGEEFDWGLRFTSGSFADNISNNQTLTDFYNRKPFGLDQAFLTYKPKAVPGLRLQGGKFEPPWSFTEMTIDNDLMVEGFNEGYTRNFKSSKLKELTFVIWQLPFLERNSGFVRNADGTVNIERSRRDGRDLAMYGGTMRARLEPNSKVALTLSAADLFFSGTQFISPVQVFGSQLQLPVTITIPATATTPAQTVTSQASIPRDFLVAGNANLGLLMPVTMPRTAMAASPPVSIW